MGGGGGFLKKKFTVGPPKKHGPSGIRTATIFLFGLTEINALGPVVQSMVSF